MPTCPNCHVEFRRRKDGACPHCDTPLQLWNGHAFRDTGSSPTVTLLERFESLVSERTSKFQHQPVIWRLPRKGQAYIKQLVFAERMLESAEYDLDLALATVEVLFRNRQFSKNYTSLGGYTLTDYGLALAVARVQLAKLERTDAVEARYFGQLQEQPNLFAD